MPAAMPIGCFGDVRCYRIPYKRQGVEEVALARGVAAYKDCEWVQFHVAESDALVAANAHALQEGRLRPFIDLVDGFVVRCGCHKSSSFPRASSPRAF